MNHYEVLGVRQDVSAEELRRAYIAEARAHHPDRHRAAGAGAAAAAEDRMRRINEAWAVLGDPSSRRTYDLRLSAATERAEADSQRLRPPPYQPPTDFVPHRPDTPEDPDEDDSWRYEPDHGDPASVPPKVLLAAPPALFAFGLALLVLSLVTGIRWLMAAGFIALLASALLFVGAPVVALFRSQLSEQRAARRRR